MQETSAPKLSPDQVGKIMKRSCAIALLVLFTLGASAQKADTLVVGSHVLEMQNLQLGNSVYVVYFKKTADGPAERITLVRISVEPTTVNGRKLFQITQRWESGDEVVHTAKTLHDANDFSTVFHETWWKRLGYSTIFDFTARRVDFKDSVEDSVKSKIIEDFNQSFGNYNLCWHSDLVIFPLLPYKQGRTFIIKFYDPGFGKAKDATYQVTGSKFLVSSDGNKIDCWVMEHKFEVPAGGSGTQRLWISKRTHEVLKEEDQQPSGYRYKLKIGISGES